VLAANAGPVHRQRLLARHQQHTTRLLCQGDLPSLPRRLAGGEIPITAVGGLTRDPQRPRQVAERAAAAQRAPGLGAGHGLQLATQLDQRLERAERILRVDRLLSQPAKTLFGSRHS